MHNADFELDARRALRMALAELHSAGVVPAAASGLAATSARICRSLQKAILREVPAFSASRNPEVLPDLERHTGDHVAEILRLLGGGEVGDLEFVRTHAHRRADQRFPLEAVLHAYRCGHRVLSRWIRDVGLGLGGGNRDLVMSAVADFGIEYTNAISTVAAADYVAHARRIAAAEGDQRAELLGLLLGGFDESDARVTRLLKLAGYLDQRQSFCVVVVRSTDPLEMENPPRVQRIVDALKGAIDSSSIRVLIGVRQHLVTAVLADSRRQSGWTAPARSIAERVQPLLLRLGPAVLVGVSGDQPSTSFVPRGLREATLALDLATVTERVLCYAQVPLRKLLLSRVVGAGPLVAPGWFDPIASADGKARGSLLETLRALADADLNVQQAARALALHPNTLYARLRRIEALTGHDARRFHDLNELLLAADCRGR